MTLYGEDLIAPLYGQESRVVAPTKALRNDSRLVLLGLNDALRQYSQDEDS